MRGAGMRQPCAAPGGRQDSGSLTLLLALLMVALLALVGLVIDGGRKLNQSASAYAIAQEAARAGAGMVDRSVAYRSGTFGVDEAQALAAARAYLVSAGYTGSVSPARGPTILGPVAGARGGSSARVRRRTAALVRGSAAVTTLGATTVGLPLMLYRLGGSPIPARLPSLQVMTFVLLHRDNGSLFLGAVRDISWLAWAAFTIAVLAEAQAALRRRPAPRLHLVGLQGAAAKLVAVASVSFTTPVGATLAAAPGGAGRRLPARPRPARCPRAAPPGH